VVNNTERILDAGVTAKFHQEDQHTIPMSLVINALGTTTTTPESQSSMQELICCMESQNKKYRCWIKEHDDNHAIHEAKFKATLEDLTTYWTTHTRTNMEHIITTQASTAEKRKEKHVHNYKNTTSTSRKSPKN
jgi:hypothetical protein